MKTLAVFVLAEVAVAASLLASLLFADVDLYGVAAVIAAIGSAIAAVYAAKAHAAVYAAKADVVIVKEDVHKVEIATNSMKDALIAATEKEALQRGNIEGRAEQKKENKEKRP